MTTDGKRAAEEALSGAKAKLARSVASGAVHLWLRAEVKPNEKRTGLTPAQCLELISDGFKITVERFPERAISDGEYEKVGCTLAETGSWEAVAPADAIIMGLKELPEADTPLKHTHIFFAHAFKNQAGWKELLMRFVRGGGSVLDLEFLTDDRGRRVAAFGYMAGFSGAAVGLDVWCQQQIAGEAAQFGKITSKPEEAVLIAEIKEKLAQAKEKAGRLPTMLVIGALGRCGTGTCDFATKAGLPAENIIRWDMAETQKGGPFPEILERADILVNCIYLMQPIPPFLSRELIESKGAERRTTVVVDVSCDATNPNNPLPFYSGCTTFDNPVVKADVNGGGPALDVVAIDHLPTLLPKESSETFAADLLPTLKALKKVDSDPVWGRAYALFEEKALAAASQ